MALSKKARQEVMKAVKRDPSLARVAKALGVSQPKQWGDDPPLPLPEDPKERERFLLGHNPDWGQ